MATVIERLRLISRTYTRNESMLEDDHNAVVDHLPALLALADAVKEAVDGSWKMQVNADREIQAFERDDVANIRKALAELEKEAT